MTEQTWSDQPIDGVEWGAPPPLPAADQWGPPPPTPDPWDVPPAARQPIDPSGGPALSQTVSTELAEATGSALAFYRHPDEVSRLAGELDRQLADLVHSALREVRELRPVGRVTAEVVSPELQTLGDAATTLEALGKALLGASRLARDLAGEVLLEVTPDGELRTTTVKAADGHGGQLKVTRTQATEVSAKPEEVVDVLAPWLESRVSNSPAVAAGYMRGVRDGVAAWRGLVSPPKFKSTALKALAEQMDAAGEHDLAIRLSHAYGTVPKGEARTTIERTEIKGE